jgi:RHS repeat-associated protein
MWRRLAAAGVIAALTAGGLAVVQHVVVAQAVSGPRAPAPARTRVNRTVPRVEPPSGAIRFSTPPTREEILQARVFAEPFVPVGEPGAADTQALAVAITTYRAAPGDVVPFEQFLRAHPTSAWRASVLANLGSAYWAGAAYSRALNAWDAAWQAAKDVETPEGRVVAGLAMASALQMLATLGNTDALELRIEAARGLTFASSAGARIRLAGQMLGHLQREPDAVIPSGAQAIEFVRAADRNADARIAPAFPNARLGQSLAEVERLAQVDGVDLVARTRPVGAAIPPRSIVHWRFGHWSAVMAARGGQYLIRDPALGGERWVPQATLLGETSSYVLVPRASAGGTWPAPSEAEAATVIGRSCPPGGPNPNEPPECPTGPGGPPGGGGPGGGGPGGPPPGGGPSCNMPTFDIKRENASLVLFDTPIGYVPARGPAVPFTLTYDYRQTMQPLVFTFGHVGPRWSVQWTSFAQEVPYYINPGWNNESIPEHVSVFLRGGGEETFVTPVSGNVYPRHWRSRAQLVRASTDPIRYERELPDGSVEVFGLADAAPVGQRRVFLTQVRDPQGHAVTLTYDAQYRIVAITDALGQVSTVQYESAGDTRRITGFTDPFGRTATLTYHPAGQLASITDVGGLTARFTYEADDFLASLETPYGISTFRHETIDPANHPFLEATDAGGGVRRVEYHFDTPEVPSSVPAGSVPAGFEAWNTDQHRFVTREWSPQAWAAGPGDPAMATVSRWFLNGWNGSYSNLLSTTVPLYVQRPGESRVWYAYPGQNRSSPTLLTGWATTPAVVARVLDDGTTQQTQASVNTLGQVTERIDALGRRTSYTYAANGIDLLEVRQTTGAANDLLASYGAYVTHVPGTVTDAAGQTTTLTYTATGKIATSTNAKSETTTYTYDAQDRLTLVTGPIAGATTAYTYDDYHRIATTTTDGITLTTAYDTFDRVTGVWYPDGTSEATTYDRLDVATRRDRLGRETRYVYDALRRLVSTRDPAGRTIRQIWCACGNLDALVDANGNRTSWERDVLGRVTREVRADGTTDTVYTYDLAGRLKTVTDPKDQVTTYTYALDDAVLSTVWTNAQVATPSVSYTYEAIYPRVATMVDGTGTTAYTYKAAGTLGAGQVASVDGPLTNDTITYSYDQLGRVTTRAINGAANTVTWAFDALGRVTTETNLLGTFTYTYDGPTSRLATVTYPNGQTSTYSYLPASQERRLQTIHHKYPNTSTLSRFDYTYDAVGNILTWQQQADSAAPTIWRYGYDRADQLIRAVQETTGGSPSILHEYAYGYDPAGNRMFEQIDTNVTAWTYTNLNRLQAQAGGGVLQIRGTVNEPATVTIQGVSAAVSSANAFQGGLPVVPGTNVFTVEARDGSGNTATAQYQVDVTNAPKSFTYDANGNLTSDGTRTFEWDARNQLVAVTVGTHRSEFAFDGLGRRSRLQDIADGTPSPELRYVWCGFQLCEERAGDGSTRLRRLGSGEEANGDARFWITDHLGSIRAKTAGGTVTVRYEGDPWGRLTIVPDSSSFAGFEQQIAGMLIAPLRSYDLETARWISEDPSGLASGSNLYRYVENVPVSRVDPLGLQSVGVEGGLSANAGFMMGGGGASCGVGAVIASSSSRCVYWQCCVRLGLGAFAGVGLNLSVAVNTAPPQSGWSCSLGVAGEAGAGPNVGGGLSASGSSVGGSGGLRPGVGYGLWAGMEMCCSRLSCSCS